MSTRPLAAVIAALLFLCTTAARAAEPAPVNPHASPEARALLRYFYSISGHQTLAGQHNYPNAIARWTDRAYDLTGKYPALFGQDFGFQGGDDKDSTLARPALIEEAERQYRNGAVVTLTWHAVPPGHDEPVSFREHVQSHLTDFEWQELTTPGTDLYKRWCAQVDVIAGYLKQLRDAHVPVLWRPYHEVNGNWFWWGGRPGQNGSAALYRQMFDRFVNYHKLDNLVWVWNANSPGSGGQGPGPYTDYFPGREYADIVSVDVYGEFKQSYYDDLVAIAAGKPVALGEVGTAPTPEILARQPGFTYFMIWSEWVETANQLDNLRALFNAPAVLTRDDPRFASAMAALRSASSAPGAVLNTPDATPEAKELLARLRNTAAEGILSGQENDPQAPAAATHQLAGMIGKYPAIYAADLNAGATRQAIIDEAKRQSRNHAVVSLTWLAARPSDQKSGKLTDYEWTELTKPGSRLNLMWDEQVDAIAVDLKQLQNAGVPVLWRPWPESNGAQFWWAGRPGIDGSAALYRQLYERLVNHHKLRNLVWVWEADAESSPATLYSDFFPGLNYVDALSLRAGDGRRGDSGLSVFAVDKPVGIEFAGRIPEAAMFDHAKWSWFLVAPGLVQPAQADALRALYGDPRVASLPAAMESQAR